MFRNPTVRFLLGPALLAGAFLLFPEWFGGILGLFVMLYLFANLTLFVATLLVAATDRLVQPAARVLEPAPWAAIAVWAAGLGVLSWVSYASGGDRMGLTVALSSVLVGLTMAVFVRWNAARVRQQTS